MISLSKFLSIISDGIIKKRLIITVNISGYILNILWVLYKYNFICGYRIKKNMIEIQLKYISERNVLGVLKQISKISKRIYKKTKIVEKDKFRNKKYILTNPEGIQLVSKNIINLAKMKGGEILFKIN